MAKRLISLIGATGSQGTGVVKELLALENLTLRILTRNSSSDKAKEFESKGVEIVEGSIFDSGSLEKLFKGANIAFVNTNFWDPEIGEKEIQLGKTIADIAKSNGVNHFIYSSLPNSKRISNGKYKVAHFSSKGEVEEYIKTLGFEFTAFPMAACYFQNFNTTLGKIEEDGSVTITIPTSKQGVDYPITTFDVNQFGIGIPSILKNPEKYNQKQISYNGSHITGSEIVEILKKLGKRVTFNQPTYSEFSNFFPGAAELADMCAWFEEYGYYGPEIDISDKEATPGLLTFEEWAKTNY